MSDHDPSEGGTPAVSLRRTYTILLIVYSLGAVFALLAGVSLTWHVDPYSECLLYSAPRGSRMEYGHEASKWGHHVRSGELIMMITFSL